MWVIDVFVVGFCVEGLHLFGPEMEKMEFEEVQELVQKSMVGVDLREIRLRFPILCT